MAGAGLRRALAALAALLAAPGLLALEPPPTADNYTVCQGDNATLSCAIDAEVTRVAWLNGSHILYAGGDKWSPDPRVRLLTHSAREFAVAIAAVGPRDEGLYTCSFQTPARPHAAHVFLAVRVPPQGPSSEEPPLCRAPGPPPDPGSVDSAAPPGLALTFGLAAIVIVTL
ncbi:igLON family member 5-like isoform X1 [Rhea pennata]|uniref:igLON family member 5-like isoform X1 n=1 Tax=Rhea pennata TaxID=8795 RepID=UPI002E25530B